MIFLWSSCSCEYIPRLNMFISSQIFVLFSPHFLIFLLLFSIHISTSSTIFWLPNSFSLSTFSHSLYSRWFARWLSMHIVDGHWLRIFLIVSWKLLAITNPWPVASFWSHFPNIWALHTAFHHLPSIHAPPLLPSSDLIPLLQPTV